MKASERISGIGCELRAIQSSDLARDPAQIAAVVVESLAILAELLEEREVTPHRKLIEDGIDIAQFAVGGYDGAQEWITRALEALKEPK